MVKRRGAAKSPKLIRPLRNTRTGLTATALVLSLLAGGAVLARRIGLTSQQKPSSVTPAELTPGNPSKEYIYAGGRLIATEEPMPTSLTPPSSLVATVNSSNPNQIDLTWVASQSTVDHYQVERSSNFSSSGNGFAFVANTLPNATSYSDIPPGSGVRAYMYRVRAADASNTTFSTYSNNDLATTIIFTDASLPGQLIKAVQLTEVRETVNAVRALADPSLFQPVQWTDPSPQNVSIKAQHMLELRSSVNTPLGVLGMTQVSSDSTLATGQPIRAVHLQDVRDKLK